MLIRKVTYKDIEGSQTLPLFNKSIKLKDSFFGSSPAPFIGRFGYPDVNVGILSPPEITENVSEYDNPKLWASKNLGITELLNYRLSLVNARIKSNVKQVEKVTEIAQLVSMASKPVDVEVKLTKAPVFRATLDMFVNPYGPNAGIKNADITSNPKISRKVDKVVDDNSLKAVEAVNYLYHKGFDENFLSKLLSTGSLGIKKQRKLVPTRHSITATDDILSKQLLEKLRYNNIGPDFACYFDGYLGNYYLVLLMPYNWSFELFEIYLPDSNNSALRYSTDYEEFNGRKNYAENCAGGYYAARLAVVEKLKELKQQYAALVLRFITDEYKVPLGVFVCREACRKSVKKQSLRFASKDLMLQYAERFIKNKFGLNPGLVLKESVLIKNILKQKRLSSFF